MSKANDTDTPGEEAAPPPPSYEQTVSDTVSAPVPGPTKLPQRLTCVYDLVHLGTGSLHIGTHSKDKRYHVVVKMAGTTLRDGPNPTSPLLGQVMMGAADLHGRKASTITVPRPGGQRDFVLTMSGSHIHCQPFRVPVTRRQSPDEKGSSSDEESFEWRKSHGPEVAHVAGTKIHGPGWKLVRLTGNRESGPGPSSSKQRQESRQKRGFGFTSDGEEIVAAGATPNVWKGPHFEFMGSGQALGEVFEIVAVVTFLRIASLSLIISDRDRSAHAGPEHDEGKGKARE